MLKGRSGGALLGDSPHEHATGIVRFASMAALRNWFDSEAYQTLAPLREDACAMTMLAYETAE